MLPPPPHHPRPSSPSPLLLLCCCCCLFFFGRGGMGAPTAPQAQEELGSRLPVTDAQVRLAAETAVGSFNGASGGHLYRLARVKMAWRKDLPGELKRYHLVFDIKETECEQKSGSRLSECLFKSDNTAMLGVCYGDVDFLPGKEAMAVGHPTCQMKKPILEETLVTWGSGCSGCAVPVSREEAQTAVDAALRVFNSANAQHKRFALKSVDRATKEVVVGLRFHVEFSVQETSCSSNGSSGQRGRCSLEALGVATLGKCRAEVAFGVGESEGRVRGFPACQLTSPVQESVPAASAPCTGCPVPIHHDDPAAWLVIRTALPVLNATAANASLPPLAPAVVLSAERHTAVGDVTHVRFTVLQGRCETPQDSVKPACEFSTGDHLTSGICTVQQKRNAQRRLSQIAIACNVSRDNETQLISRSEAVSTASTEGASTGGSVSSPGGGDAAAAADRNGKITEHLGLDVTDISHVLSPAPSDPTLTDFDLLDALG
ncbi:unnamed protein product [Lampetra planeri]